MPQTYLISYVTSGRDLLPKPESRSSREIGLIFANPTFGQLQTSYGPIEVSKTPLRSLDFDRGGFVFRPLHGSLLEAHDLTRILGKSTKVLSGVDATEKAIKSLRGPKLLHVASHGFFMSDREFSTEVLKEGIKLTASSIAENPLLRSGIALAGANERNSGHNEDGILTALEVAQLDLNGTELVVLSACDSGLGEIRNGEGIYGLRRALVLAGAETQVTSLWKVSDEATRILMVSFYEKLMKGQGRSEALRNAQLELMKNPKYSHPYYWASFLPIGDWRPLRQFQQQAKVSKVH